MALEEDSHTSQLLNDVGVGGAGWPLQHQPARSGTDPVDPLLKQIAAGNVDENSEDAKSLFEQDAFRMYCYKVRGLYKPQAQGRPQLADALAPAGLQVLPCAKRQVHDWTTCCFAHPGEKARRRDPRVHKYLAIPCPEVKQVRPARCRNGPAVCGSL
jgi:hypothetical protein